VEEEGTVDLHELALIRSHQHRHERRSTFLGTDSEDAEQRKAVMTPPKTQVN
jgi:hypothetical protein